jgi:hypothetical protein
MADLGAIAPGDTPKDAIGERSDAVLLERLRASEATPFF